MSLLPGARVGPYEIVAPLGAGGMGEVYRARDLKLNRDVAIKVLPTAFALHTERVARFTREAQTLAALNHPHIAAIYGIEESQDVRALVMELVEGDDLSHRIATGPVPVEEALAIAKQIAEALEAAHELGIVHRDLKPANIKVRADGTVKILDFGLAKALDPTPGSDASAHLANSPTITSPALTERGVILGTAAYMSPEQATGKAVDRRSDVWSFGVVVLEMLTGRPVFTGDTVSHVIASVLKSEPDWAMLPANTPPLVRRMLRHCLEKDRKRRLDSAAAARLEIEDALTTPAEWAPPSRSRAIPWLIAGMSGVALVVAALVWSPWRSATPALTTRHIVSMSRDDSLTIRGGTAISPDGRTVAFGAISPQGRYLYVRGLDEWEPRVLPLTEGASNPFFSPDGKWIAFARRNFLQKVPVSGGPPQDICKTGDQETLGGSWQSDGTIVFGAWPQVGLWKVSSDGGAAQLITQPGEGNRTWYKWPESLPGGRGILFTVWRAGRASIAVLVPGADKPRILIESGNRQRYLPTGHLVYLVDSHLVAVPFDLDRLEVRGGATVIVDDINDLRNTSDYDVSANGSLVYLPSGSSVSTIVWKDRQGVSVPIGTNSGRFGNSALSVDGERFSIEVNEGPSRNVWIGRVADGLLTRLTFGNDDAFGLWSRDGRRLFYSAGQSNYNIFSIPTDGSGKAERLLQGPHAQNATSLSPSSDTFLFNEIVPSTAGNIMAFSLSRKESRPVINTQFNESGAVFSPDGRWIAYQSNESGRAEVYAQAYPGPGAKRRVSLEGGTLPVWSHTGRELFYQTNVAMFSVPVVDAADLRLGTPRRLFLKKSGTVTGRADISADDQRFLMMEPADANQSHLNLVQNWFEELKARVPIK